MSQVCGIEGGLSICAEVVEDCLSGLTITSSRPLQTPAIFIGKRVDEVLDLLPRLYSVCGTAQACAAVSAAEQASSVIPDVSVQRYRAMILAMEGLKEHLWRIFLDWPSFIPDVEPDYPVMAQVTRQFHALKQQLNGDAGLFTLHPAALAFDGDAIRGVLKPLDNVLTEKLFGCNPLDWLGDIGDISSLQGPAAKMIAFLHQKQWEAFGSNRIAPLPELDVQWLNSQFTADSVDGFIQHPEIQGVCYETTPFTRQHRQPAVEQMVTEYGDGLLSRTIARVVEVAALWRYILQLANEPATASELSSITSLPDGVGLVQVEAARGRLVHRVMVNGGMISDYRILAPTEWNFHPNGVLATGLLDCPVEDFQSLEQQIRLWINTIDPCVSYQLEIIPS